ncbi:MAG TPA: zinc-binding dehydrogenase [Baekduia sp.]|jgi:NADPH2:quinone reductase|nr:zinc-binding dehydrogenase [Baekduia sp.]
MRAAVLHEFGTPVYGDFDAPPSDAPDGRVVLEVLAAGLNHADVAIAAGTFHSMLPDMPAVVGIDGVGRHPDGRRVYFDFPVKPWGSLAEQVLVDESRLVDVPEGLPDTTAAALGNASLAGWLSVAWTGRVQPGETVVVLGAAGIAGQVALQAAKLLGAGRVVAAGRRSDGTEQIDAIGPDAFVDLELEGTADALRAAAPDGIDVVIDPLWGAPALAAIDALGLHGRLVQVGNVAGDIDALPPGLLRRNALTIHGHNNGHIPAADRADAYRTMADHVVAGRLVVETASHPLADVADIWGLLPRAGGRKLVFVP